MQKSEKYQVMNTKVTPQARKRLEALARKKGLSVYELIQMVCDTLIRYMDDRHNLTPEMEKAMAIFEHMEGWHAAFNLADPQADPQIYEATYFLSSAAGSKKGTRAIHVNLPFFGKWTETANIQHILERTIELLLPERYRRLRALAVSEECSSILELLDHLIDWHSKDADLKAIREEFEDADRSEWGCKPKTGSPYVRKMRKDIDMFKAAEERKRQSEEAKEWLEDNMPSRPHGYEW